MVEKGTFYGVVALLACGLVATSTLAAMYYVSYQQQSSQSQNYASELNAALARSDALARSYNASVADYNRTLSVLALAVASLNTSLPAYQSASMELPELWRAYLALPKPAGESLSVYSASLKVDYGNGTQRWYNGSRVQAGWNGYVATLVLLGDRVNATWYPQFGEHLVTGIGGVEQTGASSWFVWEYQDSKWEYSQTGVDSIQVTNGTILAWTLCGYDSYYNPQCSP